jgi:hypothetical protein
MRKEIITNFLMLTCVNEVISVPKLPKNIFILIALFVAHIQIPLRSGIDNIFTQNQGKAKFGTFHTRDTFARC